MSPAILLTVYCVLIIAASLAGGLIPLVLRLTHRRMEIALSFVSGMMLGVALLHLLPHAMLERAAANATHDHDHEHAADAAHAFGHEVLDPVLLWLLAGFLAMFMIERYFCFHHHDAPGTEPPGTEPPGTEPPGTEPPGTEPPGAEAADAGACGHQHSLSWGGATIGLTLHTLIAGMALAASVQSDAQGPEALAVPGFATFLMIVLHKPFDALTIGTLMAASRRSRASRHVLNVLFSLAIPLGAALFLLPLSSAPAFPHAIVGAALAFAAGTFLCIALSDLLPELQFHRHDRLLLSLALLLGLALAWGIRLLEG